MKKLTIFALLTILVLSGCTTTEIEETNINHTKVVLTKLTAGFAESY